MCLNVWWMVWVERSSRANRCFTDTGPEDYKDAPTAVQLVGYRYEDERLMQIAGLVDEMVHGTAA